MIITTNQIEISQAIDSLKRENPSAIIGFIPTMGALHDGHMSLISQAKLSCDIVICSIFVNPAQFNRKEDLTTYPRTFNEDSLLLEKHGCDILFSPLVDTVYPNGIEPYSIDLEGIDEGMEGTFRPGHFKGVCMVVQRLFELVKPDVAFFGNKDYQQLAIVAKMTKIRQFPIKIVGVPIKRAENGLALSSRNALLTDAQRIEASLIYNALKTGLSFARCNQNAATIKTTIINCFAESEMEVEYVEIVENESLKPVDRVNHACTVCIVVYFGKVRLLDNMQF